MSEFNSSIYGVDWSGGIANMALMKIGQVRRREGLKFVGELPAGTEVCQLVADGDVVRVLNKQGKMVAAVLANGGFLHEVKCGQ